MVKIDLITGFLGSGKTTFIKKYATYLMRKGLNIGILENDHGAVNVDMMLLQELRGDQCELEMISGGCDAETHRRRFRTKLISMGMCGYDRVLVEPSGIYDIDEFFDVLRDGKFGFEGRRVRQLFVNGHGHRGAPLITRVLYFAINSGRWLRRCTRADARNARRFGGGFRPYSCFRR